MKDLAVVWYYEKKMAAEHILLGTLSKSAFTSSNIEAVTSNQNTLAICISYYCTNLY
jgi:hypothetical protein